MKAALAILLAASLLAQTRRPVPDKNAPPKLSDPFRKSEYVASGISFMRETPLFERVMDQWNRDAALCESSKQNPNPKPIPPNEIRLDYNWEAMPLVIQDNVSGQSLSFSACGKVGMSEGLTAERGLVMAMKAMRQMADTQRQEEERKRKIWDDYFEAGRKRDAEADRLRKQLGPDPGPAKRKDGRKKG